MEGSDARCMVGTCGCACLDGPAPHRDTTSLSGGALHGGGCGERNREQFRPFPRGITTGILDSWYSGCELKSSLFIYVAITLYGGTFQFSSIKIPLC
jgi:hypothetical protein